MLEQSVKELRPSLHSLGLPAVISASTLWAIAANVASSLFQIGVNAFDLAGVTTIIATVVLLLVQIAHKGLPTLSVRPVQPPQRTRSFPPISTSIH